MHHLQTLRNIVANQTYNDRNQYGSSVALEKKSSTSFHSIHCVTQKNASSLGYVDTVHSFIISVSLGMLWYNRRVRK
jgi:hypothetical protein